MSEFEVLIDGDEDGEDEDDTDVVIFADIDSEEPTHVISLAGAAESKRKQ